ncbi:hypothetical protein GE09DRAFT_1049256 [Coniochaeta sp. 2T2.1]|nr:hypothetical protein GE09DRAFT_1049256 [Coniochaeta sp. 2T2.1]
MPPVRTQKQTSLKNWLVKDCPPTQHEAFKDGKLIRMIGTATRDIKLGSSFVVIDEHIDDILAFGPVVCSKLKTFVCIYEDVSYGAKNDAVGLTDAKIASFAAACPNLTKVTLQGARNLGDASLIALLRSCPKLNTLEITGTTGGGGTAKSTPEALNTVGAPGVGAQDEEAHDQRPRRLLREGQALAQGHKGRVRDEGGPARRAGQHPRGEEVGGLGAGEVRDAHPRREEDGLEDAEEAVDGDAEAPAERAEVG